MSLAASKRCQTSVDARLVMAVDVVVAERIAEELEALGAAPPRLVAILVAREAGHHGDVGVHRVADRHALVALDDLVVFVRPLAGLGRIDEGEGERADAGARRGMDGLALGAGDPDRRMRLLQRLGHDVAHRHGEDTCPGSRDTGSSPSCWRSARPPRPTSPSSARDRCRSLRARPARPIRRCPSRPGRRRSGRAWRCARRRAPDGCSRAAPAPRRGRCGCCLVRAAQAARNTSGAEEWAYSSRK